MKKSSDLYSESLEKYLPKGTTNLKDKISDMTKEFFIYKSKLGEKENDKKKIENENFFYNFVPQEKEKLKVMIEKNKESKIENNKHKIDDMFQSKKVKNEIKDKMNVLLNEIDMEKKRSYSTNKPSLRSTNFHNYSNNYTNNNNSNLNNCYISNNYTNINANKKQFENSNNSISSYNYNFHSKNISDSTNISTITNTFNSNNNKNSNKIKSIHVFDNRGNNNTSNSNNFLTNFNLNNISNINSNSNNNINISINQQKSNFNSNNVSINSRLNSESFCTSKSLITPYENKFSKKNNSNFTLSKNTIENFYKENNLSKNNNLIFSNNFTDKNYSNRGYSTDNNFKQNRMINNPKIENHNEYLEKLIQQKIKRKKTGGDKLNFANNKTLFTEPKKNFTSFNSCNKGQNTMSYFGTKSNKNSNPQFHCVKNFDISKSNSKCNTKKKLDIFTKY